MMESPQRRPPQPQQYPVSYATVTATGSAVPSASSKVIPVVAGQETDVILPPPTPLNPIPVLTAALRLDNREQLFGFLQTNPSSSSPDPNFRQLLVFGTESLRTLLLRQVLSDPHTRTFKGKKKNWDPANVFPIPRGLNVVDTCVLSMEEDESDVLLESATAALGGITAAAAAAAATTKVAGLKGGMGQPQEHVDVVTYFLKPAHWKQTQKVASMIRSWKKSARTLHRIVYVPQPTAMIQQLLQNLGMTSAPYVSIHRLQLDLFPLETDIISLECEEEDTIRQVLDVEGTPSTMITTVARSLLKLQDVVGKIPRIQAVGHYGEEVVRKLFHLTVDDYLWLEQKQDEKETMGYATSNTSGAAASAPTPLMRPNNTVNGPVTGGQVAALFIIDRKVDMITPMISPLTYEGLLDEVVGIDCGFITVNVSTINPDEDDAPPTQGKGGAAAASVNANAESDICSLGVNGADSLYAEVRDQHVEKFGSFLQNQAVALRESHANFTSTGTKKDLSEIHQFVKQIPIFTQNLRSLTNHIHLAELVKKFTEEIGFRERWQTERSMVEGEFCYDLLDDWIACQYPPFRILRLLCLQSLCSGGIKASRYESMRRDFVQTYGYEFLFVLGNLEKAGLIKRRDMLWMDSTSPFNSLRKSLILVHAEVDTVEPNDVSYVSSGYAPLSIRLLQTAVQGWSGKEDIMRELPGRMLDVTQHVPPEDLATAMKRSPGLSLGTLAATLSPSSSAASAVNPNTASVSSVRKPTLMVLFVGGVTYMEIAALRFLSKRQSFPYHILCCTTKVVNGTTVLKSLS